jgi:DNA-binding transcriptional regulator YbjK
MEREKVKKIAISMVTKTGLINLSRRELCERAGIPDGSFPHVMGCNFTEFVEELKSEHIEESNHKVSKTRTNPALRKYHILGVAVELAKTKGYDKITRDSIAKEAGISVGLVTRYFKTMAQLKRAVMRAAIQREVTEIIAQGLANGDEHAKKAPAELKDKAAVLIANC